MKEKVILVDSNDKQTGFMDKLEAHQKGFLHRALSVFIFYSDGKLLMQKRAAGKYHSGGLWTNTCCSHPRSGENTLDAAERRLKEEMGIECKLKPVFTFIYKAQFPNGLTEHEFDHVFFGYSNAQPIIDSSEVENWKYMSIEELSEDLKKNPLNYSEWLKVCIDKVRQSLEQVS